MAMLAIKTDYEGFVTPEEEMSGFISAAQKYSRHFDIKTTQKSIDLITLMASGTIVFGTRAIGYSNHLAEQRNNRGRRSATVTQFPSPVNIQPDLSQVNVTSEGFDDAG
jgi:hypothetical protein